MATKNELYNQLLDKVQRAGGYVRLEMAERICVELQVEEGRRHTNVCALFIGNDDSSPLKLISNRFMAWDVDDYLNAEDIEKLLDVIS